MAGMGGTWSVVPRPETHEEVLTKLSATAALVLRGPPGIGKTTLAGEIADRRRSLGVQVVWLAGSSLEPIQAAQLPSASGGLDPIVVVDDVSLLDDRSAELLVDLVAGTGVRLLATARTDAPLPSSFDRLVVRGALLGVDVPPLTADQIQELVCRRLSGQLASSMLTTTALLSAGVPRYVMELIESTLSGGALQNLPDGWAFVNEPIAPSSLLEPIATRIAGLPAAQRAVFEAIALAEPLPLHAASHLAGVGVLGQLESAGFIELVAEPSHATVRLSDPLYGVAVRQHLGPLAVRDAAERAAVVLSERSVGRDAWRAACLRLEHDLPMSRDEAAEAARTALTLQDPELALRFVAEAGDDVDVLLMRGSAHANLGNVAAAEEPLRLAIATAADLGIRARAVSRLANSLITAGGRFRDAIELIESELSQMPDPRWREFLRADLVYAQSWAGEAVSAPEGMADDPTARANECLIGAVVSVMQGELDETHEFVNEGLRLVPVLVADVPAARDLLTLSRFLALAFAGKSEASRALVTAELDRAASSSDAASGTWLAVRAMQCLFDGDVHGALEICARALPRLASVDIGGLHPLTLAVSALAAARQGDTELASITLDQIPERWRSEPKVHVLSSAAAGWCAVAIGNERSAAAQFTAAGRRAVEDQHPVFGAIIAYDAVRIGRPRSALPILRDVAARCSGDLIPALLAHAEALESDRPQRLLEVAPVLPLVGFTVGGAEAAAQAAESFALRGETEQAVRSRYLAASILSRIPGAPSYAARVSRGLTRREAEIATLAAEGFTSRQIGQLLAISARTVDNHLAAVYRKLGITRRSALGAALNPDVANG